jgi:hypothetical protein
MLKLAIFLEPLDARPKPLDARPKRDRRDGASRQKTRVERLEKFPRALPLLGESSLPLERIARIAFMSNNTILSDVTKVYKTLNH